jgi:predicted unusual protein kinase regulating ubiquinone biosynthesis (AarF/ABC1/UbiB family)
VTIDRGRYRKILWFFGRVILHLVWWDLLVGRLVKGRVRRTRPERFRRISRRFRALAIEMGGVMIKLGQFLSARVDVLPVEVTEELAGLQDEVPAVPGEQIQVVLRQELGDLSARFAHFEMVPQAAASLGQAHRAWLRRGGEAGIGGLGDEEGNSGELGGTRGNSRREGELSSVNGEAEGRGRAVVVKVQRPGIERLVETDLAALRVVARWAMRYPPIRRRANVPALMEEFAGTLREELDYKLEASNAERLAKIFSDDPGIKIPAIYHEHSTGRVLTLENVEGIKIADVEGLAAAGIDPKAVAERLFDSYFRQIFKEGFFHADPHPGNLFVLPALDSNEGREVRSEAEESSTQSSVLGPRSFILVFIDFGMVGRIPAGMRENLQKVLVSVTRRDARALTEAYNDLGFFLPGSDLERINEAQAVLLDHLWGRNLLELANPDPAEVQALGKEFRDILFDFPFQIPQDFIYLGRTLGMLSGLVSRLDPTINPWRQIEKFGRELLSGREGVQLGWETVLSYLRPLLAVPDQVQRVLAAAEGGRLRVQTVPDRQVMRRMERLERRVGQLNWSVLAGAMLFSGTLLYINGDEGLGVAGWIVSGVIFLWWLIRPEP